MVNYIDNVYVIGSNKNRECGLSHNKNVKRLTLIKLNNVSKIYCSSGYTIFATNNHKDVWIAGNGHNKYLPTYQSKPPIFIKHFKQRNINIKSILAVIVLSI